MKPTVAYRIVLSLLVVLVLMAAGLCLFIRVPTEASGPQVVAAVETTGRIRLLIEQVDAACRSAIRLDATSPQEDYDLARAWLKALEVAIQKEIQQIPEVGNTWIPVAEAVVLLEETDKLITLTLQRMPQQPVPEIAAAQVDVLEDDPDIVGITPEARAMIEAQLKQLGAQSVSLRGRVERAVLMKSLARDSLVGIEVKYLLLFLMVLSVVIAWLAIRRAVAVMSIPPEQALESKIKLHARSHPEAAVKSCYEQSRRLLQVADELYTRSKLSRTETAGTRTAEPVEVSA